MINQHSNILNCKQCLKTFVIKSSRLGTAKFCSRKCYGKNRLGTSTKIIPSIIVDKHGYSEVIIKNKYNNEIARSKIDNELKLLVSKHSWSLHNAGYAVRVENKNKSIFLHHLIIPKVYKMHVDHINGDKLDNRRDNLRLVTVSKNILNMKKERGVSYLKEVKKWRAYIGKNYKQIHLGLFKSKKKALEARNNAEK